MHSVREAAVGTSDTRVYFYYVCDQVRVVAPRELPGGYTPLHCLQHRDSLLHSTAHVAVCHAGGGEALLTCSAAASAAARNTPSTCRHVYGAQGRCYRGINSPCSLYAYNLCVGKYGSFNESQYMPEVPRFCTAPSSAPPGTWLHYSPHRAHPALVLHLARCW